MLKLFGFLILCFTIAVHATEADDDVDDFELRKLKIIPFFYKRFYGHFVILNHIFILRYH